MQLIPLKAKLIQPNDNLNKAIQTSLDTNSQTLKEGDILVIASKVVAYAQGRLKPAKNKKEFKMLIQKEADRVLGDGEMVITLKKRILIPNAGIDNSNTPKGQVILWPQDAFKTARQILTSLKQTFKLKKLGVLINDSNCQPLRMGTSGIAIGWAGFEGVHDERGKKDLFGKKMTYTKMALADNLASAANLLMGETDASIPFVIVRDFKVQFSNRKFSEEDYFIDPKECIYRNFYNEELLENF